MSSMHTFVEAGWRSHPRFGLLAFPKAYNCI